MLAKEDAEKEKQFHEMNHIAQIIGYSEASHSQFYPAATIVNAESQNGYIFNYKPGTQLKGLIELLHSSYAGMMNHLFRLRKCCLFCQMI